jgi:hypothetical protein
LELEREKRMKSWKGCEIKYIKWENEKKDDWKRDNGDMAGGGMEIV